MAAMLALGAAMTWGVADFLGGLTSRRIDELLVAGLSQLAGLALLAVALPLLPGSPSGAALGWGALAGLGGAVGLVGYFRALAIGPMGVTAPVAALVGGAVPVTAGLLAGERPGVVAVLGILVGLLAVVLVSRPADATGAAEPSDDDAAEGVVATDDAMVAGAAAPGGGATAGAGGAGPRVGLLWAMLAGLGFGWFFVGLDLTPDASGMWPLLGARLAGLTAIGLLLGVRRPVVPRGRPVAVALGSGVLDMAANALFLLAVRQGLLVLVSVLTSLYPVGVVLLARTVLGERLGRVQVVGIGLALTATALIAA